MQLVAGIVLDRFRLPVRFPEANAVLAKVSAGADPQVIFLGSSRFMGGVASDEIARRSGRRPDAVLNAAVPAGDVITADFILAQLLERGAHPGLVVLEVSPDTLNHRTCWLRYHVIRQFTWTDLPRYVGDMVAQREMGTVLLSRLLPLHYYRHLILTHGAPLPQPRQLPARSDADAAPSMALSPEQLALSQRGVVHARQMVEDFHIGGRTAEALERILSRCDSIGASVLLVGAPVTSAFRTAYTPEIDAAYRAYLDDAARRHDCRLLDYRDRVPDGLFEDTHHLSVEGCRYFSRLLAREALPAD